MNEHSDPTVGWPTGPRLDRDAWLDARRFVVHWRSGRRVLSEAGTAAPRTATAAPPEQDAAASIDLRETVDLRPARIWDLELGRDVLDRIVFRLIGDVDTTVELVNDVVGDDPAVHARRAVTDALSFVLEHQGPLGEVRVLRVDGVVFADHRLRLCRELLRWPPVPRVVLALRHLGELDVDEISSIVGWPVDQVREVAGAWWSDDQTTIVSNGGHPLRHLDPHGGALRSGSNARSAASTS